MGVPSLNDLAVDGTLNTTNQPQFINAMSFLLQGFGKLTGVLRASVRRFLRGRDGFSDGEADGDCVLRPVLFKIQTPAVLRCQTKNHNDSGTHHFPQ